MNQAVTLYRLQQVDSQIDQHNRRIKEIDQILADDQELINAEKNLAEKEQLLTEARKLLKRAEADTQAQRIKIEFNQAQLFGGAVKNPKVLQDLQLESEALKRFLAVLEDKQLEAMLEVEDATSAFKEATTALEQIKARRVESMASLNGEKSRLLANLESLQKERVLIIPGIPGEQLVLYDKLRESRKGVAVSMVKDNACSACGSSLSSALLQAARMPSQLARCDTCGRILYAV